MIPLAATLVMLLAAAPAAAPEPSPPPEIGHRLEFVPVRIINGHLLEGRFRQPTGLSWEPEEKILYVCDLEASKIALVDQRGVSFFSFGSQRSFQSPSRVLGLPDGRILVGDYNATGVRVFDYDGQRLADLDLSRAPAAERPVSVSGLARGADGTIFVLDGPNHRVLAVQPDGTVGAFGPPGGRDDLLRAPQDIEVAPDGNLVVSDGSGVAVQVYSRDGKLLRGWGTHDSGPGEFSLPAGLAVDEAGRIFVADTLRQDVKVFAPSGDFLTRFGGYGRGPGGLMYPLDVASDRAGKVFVSERLSRRVQVFQVREVPVR